MADENSIPVTDQSPDAESVPVERKDWEEEATNQTQAVPAEELTDDILEGKSTEAEAPQEGGVEEPTK